MIEPRGWGLPESHLLPDAVVAFVDGELSLAARDRAASHVAGCAGCAAEVTAQRQARAAVQGAPAPAMSAGFLASLRSIPDDTEVSTAPENLAVTEDGQLVVVQRPDRVPSPLVDAGDAGQGQAASGALGSALPIGTSTPLGSSANVLGQGRFGPGGRKRASQGAGVVVSGLMLSALALVATSSGDARPGPSGSIGPAQQGVLRAQFGADVNPSPAPAGNAPAEVVTSQVPAIPTARPGAPPAAEPAPGRPDSPAPAATTVVGG